MTTDPAPRVIYLTGPTAVGKTAVGVALARRLGAEVVALDSMTVYRGMDVGTAKPTVDERGDVAHHLIDLVGPDEAFSVAEYRRRAMEVVREIEARGGRALFVGGTPLYLKAMLRGLFDGPGANAESRRELEETAARLGPAALHERLAAVDPATAARLHPNDVRRVVRALEVVAATGSPLSSFQTGHARPAEGALVFALARPRAELCARIDARVVRMFEEGLVDEARAIQGGPSPFGPVAAQAVGYREALDLLTGRIGRAAAIERTQARTRQFSKRQATWFRGLAEVEPWPVDPSESAEATADRLAARIARADESAGAIDAIPLDAGPPSF